MAEQKCYHTTVLLHEAVEALNIRENGTYVDCTFGGGGHSRLILSRLGREGRLIVFDQDKDAWKNVPDDTRLVLVKENFRFLKKFLRLHQATHVDGILADLGVSSHQFDTGERGFSTRFDGPLDMRMDDRSELKATDILQSYTESDLHRLFEQYGEVRNAKQLAKHIVNNRGRSGIKTTEELKIFLQTVIKGNPQRYLAQVFQALRIEVNDELGALRALLEQSAQCLKPGGRLSIISFHSLEDRLVKQFIRQGAWHIEEDPLGLKPVPKAIFKEINKKPVEPGEEEIRNNPRSRSARLRIAEKL